MHKYKISFVGASDHFTNKPDARIILEECLSLGGIYIEQIQIEDYNSPFENEIKNYLWKPFEELLIHGKVNLLNCYVDYYFTKSDWEKDQPEEEEYSLTTFIDNHACNLVTLAGFREENGTYTLEVIENGGLNQ